MKYDDKSEQATEAAFKNPQVGDWFHEFFSYVVTVQAILPDGAIVTRDSLDGRKVWDSAEDFADKYKYNRIPGFSVRYGGRTNE